ncbi:MAG: tRNA pseudouridine(38-40) synthase TruA [Acidobacteriota bacterium]|nr:MAG: tRNA pseudouridine(38-40) synthase TruA [Acidobacteriota bacterium]
MPERSNQPEGEMRQAPSKRYKVTVRYVGSRYHGWQIQPKHLTVQQVIAETVSRLAGQPVSIIGASRTDSGVHAMGQVAHFDFPHRPSVPQIQKALNALLPWDIQILSLRPVSPTFHAQKDAIRKRYVYRIFNGMNLSPFDYERVLQIRHPLDVEAMQRAAAALRGTHDFTSFAAATTTVKSKTRTLFDSRLVRRGRYLTYHVEADGFLHHMIRNIVGTLIEIGLGKRRPEAVQPLIDAKNRDLAGPTAGPEGLYLMQIWY